MSAGLLFKTRSERRPAAHAAWHAHPGGQTLYVTEGRGLAEPDYFMTHIAMWEVDDNRTSATWGALVTDEEYRAPTRLASQES